MVEPALVLLLIIIIFGLAFQDAGYTNYGERFDNHRYAKHSDLPEIKIDDAFIKDNEEELEKLGK